MLDYTFISKLKTGQRIKFLPNIKDDGTKAIDDIVRVPSLYLKSCNKIYYDSLTDPLLPLLPYRSTLYKKFDMKYLSYVLVDGVYKIIIFGSTINGKVVREFSKGENLEGKYMEIKIKDRNIPDYSESEFIEGKYPFDIKNNSEFMLYRPFSIETFITSNTIQGSSECFNYINDKYPELKDITIPYFRKHRISMILDEIK